MSDNDSIDQPIVGMTRLARRLERKEPRRRVGGWGPLALQERRQQRAPPAVKLPRQSDRAKVLSQAHVLSHIASLQKKPDLGAVGRLLDQNVDLLNPAHRQTLMNALPPGVSGATQEGIIAQAKADLKYAQTLAIRNMSGKHVCDIHREFLRTQELLIEVCTARNDMTDLGLRIALTKHIATLREKVETLNTQFHAAIRKHHMDCADAVDSGMRSSHSITIYPGTDSNLRLFEEQRLAGLLATNDYPSSVHSTTPYVYIAAYGPERMIVVVPRHSNAAAFQL